MLACAGVRDLRISRRKIISRIGQHHRALSQKLVNFRSAQRKKHTTLLNAISDASQAQSRQHAHLTSDTAILLGRVSNILDILNSNKNDSQTFCNRKQQITITGNGSGSNHLLLLHDLSQDGLRLVQLLLHIVRSLLR